MCGVDNSSRSTNIPRNRRGGTLAARLRTLGICIGASLILGGCYSEGGLGWSADQYVYVSHEYQPWTVSVHDTRSGQKVWWIDVPVGQQLVIHFIPDEGTESSLAPDVMEWALMKSGTEFAPLPNRLAVPPARARRVETMLRPTPELPRDVRPADTRPPVTQVNDPVTPPSGE